MFTFQNKATLYKQTIEQLGGPRFIQAFADDTHTSLLMTMLAFPEVIKPLLPTPPTVYYAPNHEHRIKTLLDHLHVNKRSSLRFHP